MAATATATAPAPTLQTLPSDQLRALQWRFAERFELIMLVQAVRPVARGPVARLVAQGGRSTHDWTAGKNALLAVYDEAGISAAFLDTKHGGFIEGPKNLALALVAFELSWVDAGAATCSLASNLGVAPIHERGTPEQVAHYMPLVCPPAPGDSREATRVAFALTEPIPFVGVETGLLGGKMRIATWEDGQAPVLHIDKRGRFITNMDFANVVTAAVDSADPRIKGSCIVILEKTDPGLWDSGVPTRKMVHQLSSTCDPVFNLTVPASRIVGGYTVKDGVLIPNFSHSEIIEAVFRRTRVTVGLMTSAKLLSSIEPIIRYQRSRFRGGETGTPGSPRYDLGLQTKPDVLHRLVDIWATGEAGAALGFATARLFDCLDPLDRAKDRLFAEQGLTGRSALKALAKIQQDATDCIELRRQPEATRDQARLALLESNPLVEYAILDAQANVFCPACKLWNTGHGATIMREAVSLMGGYGITEDCPGFLPHKWMDAQLEATYEGPEAVQRRQLSVTMTNGLFLAQFEGWIKDLKAIAAEHPGTGACVLGSAMALWLWSVRHLQTATDANGARLYQSNRQGITFPLADALCWLIASRQQILDVVDLGTAGEADPAVADELPGALAFLSDLCHVQAARAAGETARICSELVFGYNQHPAWTAQACAACYDTADLDHLEGIMPGIASGTRGVADIISTDQAHPAKAGPCPDTSRFQSSFLRMRSKLDGCLYGFGLAKDRAANALTTVMIPEALDYPQ
ncbi:MAG: acyl-CoA/acyl-ACP dehydrogenase [Verrucomicrobia bacterium]|nr:acyl-CoA/acyl-ACP dehydrogenase [Verrucomicrobiota bacterium]